MRLTILLAAALVGVCTAQPLRFESRNLKLQNSKCAGQEGCANADFQLLELVSGPPAVRKRINAAIQKFAPQKEARDFVKDPEAGANWFMQKQVKVLRAAGPVISLEATESEFTGGAHPSGATSYLNFDAATGEPVKLAAIVKDGALPRLTAIAERYFRKARELSATESLAEAGFNFPAGFQLNENFGLSDKELRFTYNQYEIAPYMMGPTEIAVPLAEISDLLRSGMLR